MFTNAIYNMIEDICNETSRERLTSACMLFLEQSEHIRDMKAPENLAQKRGEPFSLVFFAVRKVLSGLAGLSNPEPGVCTLEEMQYIYPTNFQHSKGFMKDVPRVGRSVVTALRREGEESKARWYLFQQEFLTTIGFASQVEKDFKDLKEAVQNMVVKLKFFSNGLDCDF